MRTFQQLEEEMDLAEAALDHAIGSGDKDECNRLTEYIRELNAELILLCMFSTKGTKQ